MNHKVISVLLACVLIQCMCLSFARADWKDSWNSQADHYMMSRYYVTKGDEKVRLLRAKYPAGTFAQDSKTVRAALRKQYMMPPFPERPEKDQLIREVTVDGMKVEVHLFTIAPGIYSVANVYKPSSAQGKLPAVLLMPGHGDVIAASYFQEECLSFAKRGYLVMSVDHFGGDQLGDVPLWNEYHGCGASEFLLVSGIAFHGTVVAIHEAELGYLINRPDVDRSRVAVTGASGGGTHTLWLTAIDERATVAVPVCPAGMLGSPVRDNVWRCACDFAPGLYNVADGNILRALVAPRALMVAYESTQSPITREGALLFQEGKVTWGDMEHRVPDADLMNQFPFARDVYADCGIPERYSERVLKEPHSYDRAFRELAAHWMDRFMLGNNDAKTIPEASMNPLKGREGVRQLKVWPDRKRPADFMGPTEWTKACTKECVERLPHPESRHELSGYLSELKTKLPQVISLPKYSRVQCQESGSIAIGDETVSKCVVTPEPGIRVPILVFWPSSAPKGIYVMISTNGAASSAESTRRKELVANGYMVACPDLRGMGTTSYGLEVRTYDGFRDSDFCTNALKLGDTVAGYWTRDILATVEVAEKTAGKNLPVTLCAEREAALCAIFAATLTDKIVCVETEGLLASYYSPKGYGLNMAYCDPSGKHTDERNAKLGGYGSMVPCIPNILKYGDVPQLASMLCSKRLVIKSPVAADGTTLTQTEARESFAWALQAYKMMGKDGNLVIE